ncbi:MAG: YceD family protein [Burkholderiaceae bacterium]
MGHDSLTLKRVNFDPARLDVAAFAQAGAALKGEAALADWPRLAAEAAGATATAASGKQPATDPVRWTASGELRRVAGGAAQPWLHLEASARLPMTCQRCLGPVEVALSVDRRFRFVADERTAELEDDESDEDLLVASRQFDLPGLIEDELLMALPLVPRHEQCPQRLPTSAGEAAAAETERPHPFAALAKLKR